MSTVTALIEIETKINEIKILLSQNGLSHMQIGGWVQVSVHEDLKHAHRKLVLQNNEIFNKSLYIRIKACIKILFNRYKEKETS